MNLWVNRIGQLLTLAVALFFFSCQEDIRLSGLPSVSGRSQVRTVEIPISSSVIFKDSLRTSNYAFTSEPSRLLVGAYHDDKFGNVTANAYTQYFTTSATKLAASAIYDSVSLTLQFDYYHYGSTALTPQNLTVYELDRVLLFDSIRRYYNKSSAATSSVIGSKDYTVKTSDLDKFATDATASGRPDTFRLVLNIPLDQTFGQKIFTAATKYRDDVAAGKPDSVAFLDFTAFTKVFKGIALKSGNADKLVGFSPSNGNSRINVHYHYNDTVKAAIGMALVPAVAFNQITSDKSGTEIAELNTYNKDLLVDSENRYVQSGVGIFTKVDLSNYYSFIDTIPNILVNDVKLVVGSVEASDLPPPSSLVLRAITDNNYYRRVTSQTDKLNVLTAYNTVRGPFISFDLASGTTAAVIESDSAYYALGDSGPTIPFITAKRAYEGNMTLFFQKLAVNNTVDGIKFKKFLLVPGSQASTTPAFQSAAKSVNRAVFPKSGIKLRILYTKPIGVQ